MRIWNVRPFLSTGLLLTLVCVTPFPVFRNIGQATASAASLDAYGGCTGPSHQGFNICNPPEGSTPFTWSTGSPVQVIAAATSGTGQVATMEVWADGKKVAQSEGSPFDQPIKLDTGTHTLQLAAIDSTGAELKSLKFQVDVMEGNGDGNCSAPGSPGVNICEPQDNGCNSQPWVNLVATGKGKSGTVERMELWIDGDDVANFPGDHFNTNLIMVSGTITVKEVDSKGHTASSSISFNGPC
jgi:hypothetical protein